MDIFNAIYERRSVRVFTDENIPKQTIGKIIDAARAAPSACNEQLWQFIVIENKHTKKRLIEKAGSAKLILNAPVVTAIYYHSKNKLLGIQSASAAIQNMLLAATALKVGSLWLSAVGNRRIVNEILMIPNNYYLVAFVLFGYSNKKKITPPPKRPRSEVLHFDVFGGEDTEFSHMPDKWTLDKIRIFQQYYCRKTDLGTKMEVTNDDELSIITNHIKKIKKGDKILDLFTYDASYIGCYANSQSVFTLDLSHETSIYTREAIQKDSTNIVFDGKNIPFKDESVDMVSIIFKLERMPRRDWKDIFNEIYRVLKNNGSLLIVYRSKFSLYYMFYKLLIKILGDDITKTAIFSYFGPFCPISGVESELKKYAFKTSKYSHFTIPMIFGEYLELFIQYKISGGTTFLHRIHRDTLLTKFVKRLIDICSPLSLFGSMDIIIAEKRNKF